MWSASQEAKPDMARASNNKKKAPPRPNARGKKSTKKSGKKTSKKRASKNMGRSTPPREEEPEDEDLELEDADEDEEGEDDDTGDEDDDDDDDEKPATPSNTSGGSNKPKRERDKSPIAKRLAKRIMKKHSGLLKLAKIVSTWRDAHDVHVQLTAATSAMVKAADLLNAKPDDYKPRDRQPRERVELKENQSVRVVGSTQREIYSDLYGEEAIDDLKVLRLKGRQAVVATPDGEKFAISSAALAPKDAD